ncbi:hypothetical protein [uncultured Enterovirga sp.]|uniref:hypothetical protein n=1 Tax=uncultured Enterovirga sp. TaxID=2026352 RepID=UPI0035CAADCD
MITDSVLDLAVEKGLIAPGQAAALRSLARQEEPELRPEPVDEERLRFVTGFADIFVTLGLVLFLGSAAYLIGRHLSDGPTAALVALLAWALAEFFTRRRRMALPSIVLLVVFTSAVFLALVAALGSEPGQAGPRLGWLDIVVRPNRDPLTSALAGLATAAAAALHYLRFRVPITIAAGVAALAFMVLMLFYVGAPDLTARLANPILLALGIGAFAIAMRFDLADPARRTRRTDIAFWLHLLAAPLIVHSLFDMIGVGRGLLPPGAAAIVLAIFLALAIVAVFVDRRAILVSGLVYAGVAFASLIRSVGLSDTTTPVTMLALGAFVLLLSAGWAPLRRGLLGFAPEGLVARLPRPVSP